MREHLSEQELFSIVSDFESAAVGAGCWVSALEHFAKATGSRVGELIGLGNHHSVPFNWVAGLGAEWQEDFLVMDGGNPEVNPYLRAGVGVAELTTVSSEQFISSQDRRQNTFLNEHAIKFDIPHACLCPLVLGEDMLIGLAVMRSKKEGPIKPDQLNVFKSLAPLVRSAVKTQLALENQGAQLMAAGLDAVSIPAFVCDRAGRVRALTEQADGLIARAGVVALKNGHLRVTGAGGEFLIEELIRKVMQPYKGDACQDMDALYLKDPDNIPFKIQVVPVPLVDTGYSFDPRVIVVVKECGSPKGSLRGLMTCYDLTRAEAEVARCLSVGLSPAEISETRRKSLSTIRTQIRNVYAKMDIHHTSELINRVNALS